MPELCGHYEGGDHCGVLTERRYLPGYRCPQHTPAVLAGRPEPTPDPAMTGTARMARTDLYANTKGDRYGNAHDDMPPGQEKVRANPRR